MSRPGRRTASKRGQAPAHLRPRPELDALFNELADLERLQLIEAMLSHSRAAASLAAHLGWTRDEASKQLNRLKRAGMAIAGPYRRSIEYALVGERFGAARDWLADLWQAASPIGLEHAPVLQPEQQARLAAALRNVRRRRMLEFVCGAGARSQAEIVDACLISQGLASRGLAILEEAGLVTVRQEGGLMRFRASPEGLSAAVRWMLHLSAAAKEAEARGRFRLAASARGARRVGGAGRVSRTKPR